MQAIKTGFRKAGDYARQHPVVSGLVVGGSVLGTVGILKGLTKDEQQEVVGAAIQAEQDGGGEVLGLSSGSLLGAAVVMGILDEFQDEDESLMSQRPAMRASRDSGRRIYS